MRLLLFMLLGLVAAMSQAIVLKTGSSTINSIAGTPAGEKQEMPNFNLAFNEDSTKINFHVQIPTVEVVEDSILYPGTYSWSVKDFYPSLIPGTPSLPQRTIVFSLPAAAENITLSEDFSQWSCISGHTPTPARPPLKITDSENYSLEQVPPITYEYKEHTAAQILKTEEDMGQILVYVQLTPFILNSDMTSVSTCHNFSYTLSYSRNDGGTRQKSRDFGDLTIGSKDLAEGYRTAADYLIITTPSFEPLLKDYAEWKRTFGHKVGVASKQCWTCNEIKDSIVAAYRLNNNLNYVILAGSYENIPAMISSSYHYYDKDLFPSGEMRTDYYYSCLDGENDSIPNVYTGRFLANSETEMKEIIAKSKSFFSSGCSVNGFFDKATHVSRFESFRGSDYTHRTFISTSEDLRNHVIANGKDVKRVYDADAGSKPMYFLNGNKKTLLPTELQYGNFDWSATTQDVADSFNEGNMYILYNAHGAYSGWGQPSFGYFDFNLLNNKNALPIVFSMTCNTGNFVTDDGFARHLLTCSNGGAKAVIAAERTSYNNFNDQIAIGIFQTLWPTPQISTNIIDTSIPFIIEIPQKNPDGTYGLYAEYSKTLGNLLHIGKRYMNRVAYLNHDYIRWHNEMYHIFGDPGAYIHTEHPTEFSDASYSIKKKEDDPNKYTVTVSTSDNVMIGFYNESTGVSECFKYKSVSREISKSDNFHFKLWAVNKIPYSIDVRDGVTSFSGPVILDSATHPSSSISSTSHNGSELSVKLNIYENELATSLYSLELRDLNNNLIDFQNIGNHAEYSSLSTIKAVPGIYVVRLLENENVIDYRKIILK